ncbi:MAG: endonuclease/exonuclease/phosphatase family protein [Planctomycetota bacterium]
MIHRARPALLIAALPIAALALAFALAACGGLSPASRSDSAAETRPETRVQARNQLLVMGWNIRFGTADDGPNSWPNRADRVADVIVDPLGDGTGTPGNPLFDIVGLQEALRFQIDELLAAAPAYAYAGAGRDDGIDAGEHCGILYRADRFELLDSGVFWLSDTPEEPGSTSWGNELTRICTWARLLPAGSEQAFYVFNTHLDHQSEPSRREAVELIAFRIETRDAPEEPVILMGDFNARPESAERRYLTGDIADATGDGTAPRSPDMIDVLEVNLDEGEEPLATFNGWRYTPGRPGHSIDTILAAGFTVVAGSVEQALGLSEDLRPPSDHYPIVATLRFD